MRVGHSVILNFMESSIVYRSWEFLLIFSACFVVISTYAGCMACLYSVAEFSEGLFYASSPFRNFNSLRFSSQYWTKWSAVKSIWVKVIRKLPCRYGKEFAEGWGSWSFVLNPAVFRIRYLRRVCMNGSVLINRISDSLKTLVIITYSTKSSGRHLCQSVKIIQRFRNLLCPPFHGAPWRGGSLSVKCHSILTPDATICPRRFNWIL